MSAEEKTHTNPNVHSNVDVGFSLTSVCLSPKRALINSNPKAMIQWLLEQSSSTISCLQGPLARPTFSWFSSGMTCVKVYCHWIVFMVQPARAQAKTTRPVLTTSNTPRQHGKTFMCPSQKTGCKRYVLYPSMWQPRFFKKQVVSTKKASEKIVLGIVLPKNQASGMTIMNCHKNWRIPTLASRDFTSFGHKHLPNILIANLDCQIWRGRWKPAFTPVRPTFY